jgi:uncharacterized protein YabN with tetrapyrrole methylase and pyrophosphatase domain
MLKIVITSLKKQLKQVRHPHVQENAQEQDEQQVQLMGDELVNARNMDGAQKVKVDKQYQNVVELVV